ncbi:hypothetical protein Anapl_14510 [Anas platyrhynchos]|uniref:Uncharacterized protein n=1 Tax=Anas platyrhynchos TaxID=8839 RepID=R0KNE4_ANAPL|nr:hypothetical protein Anapl_14510 [Anas platyrhynchos]
MQSNLTARPATLEHHVPSTNNDSHTATKVWYCCIDSTEAAGTQKPLTPNRQKASQRSKEVLLSMQETLGSDSSCQPMPKGCSALSLPQAWQEEQPEQEPD